MSFVRGLRSGRGWLVPMSVVLALFTLHAVVPFGGAPIDLFFARWLNALVCVAPGLFVLGRAIRVPRERLAWSLIGAGLTLWGIGNVYYLFFLHDPIPIPSPADAMWITFYLLSYAGLVLLMRSRIAAVRASAWLDGLIGAAAIAALATAIVFDTVLHAVGGSKWAVATNLTYPLADGVLIALVVVVLAVSGWVAGRAWAVIALGFAVFAVSDSFYLYQSAVGSYVPGRLVDVGWPLGMLLVAYAASLRSPAAASVRLDGLASLVLPVLFGLGAVTLLVYDHFDRLNVVALALACISVLGVVARMGLAFIENMRVLATSRHEAVTDILTGLPNRRRLMLDLEQHLGEGEDAEPRVLALFDLNGFKHYNDAFGHAAGDVLLARLGGCLADAAAPAGTAYRIGGDEFCVLGPPEMRPESLADALREEGLGFSVSASFGSVVLPAEAPTVSEALSTVDDRMYAQKTNARQSAGEQSSNVLFQALAERDRGLGEHLEGVTELAVAVGVKLGVESDVLHQLRWAARLHDVGKMAVPESILLKRGRLDEREWEFVRRHTVVGQRILEAAPSLGGTGAVVRSSHERWDGTGYPDGLAGEDIPLAARVVSVCDAFDAMVSDRPYRPALSAGEALQELVRGAGTQFDSAVVSAFLAALAERPPSRARVPEPAVDVPRGARLRVVEAEDDPPELAAAGSG
jgi:diguanylate cyclase (GGDEF)-like protein